MYMGISIAAEVSDEGGGMAGHYFIRCHDSTVFLDRDIAISRMLEGVTISLLW